jgi:glycosyltransferase involved in cell wall biosynthesis
VPTPDVLRAALTVEQLWQPVPGGSGTYIVELARELADDPTLDVVGISAHHRAPAPADWAPPVPVRSSRLPRRALYEAWQHLPGPLAESIAGRADVVHATTWAVPATRRPMAVTVHDVAFLHDPAHFTGRGNTFFRRALERVRGNDAAIIVPSQATADDCLQVGLPSTRITVVPHGVRVGRPDPQTVLEFRSRSGLNREYVLWCGTIEPRKNLSTLLTAFADAAVDLPDVDLVLVGPAGWGALPPVPSSLSPDRVHVLGHLSRADLDAAYAGAAAFCFPSLREGFGLPVLEAMQHGLPVVTSRGTACAEVGGDAALLVDPLDATEVARALVTAVRERADLSARSRSRAAGFTWREAAARTAEVYRDLTR